MIKRATCKTWAEYFEKHEGVRISEDSIRNNLEEAGKIGKAARNKVGRLLRNAYFSEVDVREACFALLPSFPQADDSDFFVHDSVRHGTVQSWSRELGISVLSIASRLSSASVRFMGGKNKNNHIQEFYPETAVRQACSDLLRPMPKADKSGFFVMGGVRYGTIRVWCRTLGLHPRRVINRLRTFPIPSVEGKDLSGRPRDFYPEPAFRQACAEIIHGLPYVEEEWGRFVLDGIRHGTSSFWSFELRIRRAIILSCLSNASVQSVKGRDEDGRRQDFYPEPAVREACADILRGMLPRVDRNGFFELDGIRHGTAFTWSRELWLSYKVIASCLSNVSVQSVKGRDTYDGKYRDFYPEPAVRAACADILRGINWADVNGLFELDGIRHGTMGFWSRELAISVPAIAVRLHSASVQSVEGKQRGGRKQDFYPEPAVRAACASLLAKRKK